MKRQSFIWLTMLFCVAPSAGWAGTNDFFAPGLALARAGQFPEAAAAFSKAAKTQSAVGTLVNVGIAEWQCGHAGAAILAWEQAQWINPFDARPAGNLKFAREVAQVDAPDLKWFETASTWLPANAWLWVAGASLWLAGGVLILPGIFWRRKTNGDSWNLSRRLPGRRRAGWHQALAAVSFGIFLFSLAANDGVISRTDLGFVLKKNAPLQLTPTKESEVVSTLTAGEPARRLRTRGNYYLIRTSFGSGWIERNQFGLVNPE